MELTREQIIEELQRLRMELDSIPRTPAMGSGAGFEPGMVVAWAGTTIPYGFLGCDGSAVSRTDYADLFAAIGTAFGVGDGSTTFNLPDFRKRAPYGSGTGYARGASDGAAEGDRLPGGGGTTSAAAQWDHGHNVYWPGSVEVQAGAGQAVSLPGSYGTTEASYGPHDHEGSKGGYQCAGWIIKI